MNALSVYISQLDQVRNHHEHKQPSTDRRVVRNALDPMRLLPLLQRVNLFKAMHLPIKIQQTLCRSMEIHIIPSLHRVVDLERATPSPTPVKTGMARSRSRSLNLLSHTLPPSNTLSTGICKSKDLGFLILSNNSIEMIAAGGTVICTLSAGDAVGIIPERHVFTEFASVFSRASAVPSGSVLLLAFPVLMLRNCVVGGLERVVWQHHGWMELLQLIQAPPATPTSASPPPLPPPPPPPPDESHIRALIAGMVRPIFLSVAPRREDLKELVANLIVHLVDKGDTIYDDNHDRPKQKERYWFVVFSGSASVQMWEEDDVVKHQYQLRKHHRCTTATDSTTVPPPPKAPKHNASHICHAGDTFGIWNSSDRRRTFAKAAEDHTVLLKMSELHVDRLLQPLMIRQLLRSREFTTLVEKNLTTSMTATASNSDSYVQLHALGRTLTFLKDLNTNIRNRLLDNSGKFMQLSGGIVWSQNDHATFAIVLLEGELVARTASGVYKRVEPGQMFGASCFNGCQRRFCTLETVQPNAIVKLLSIGVVDFNNARREQLVLRDIFLNNEMVHSSETEIDDLAHTTHQHGFHNPSSIAVSIPVHEILADDFTSSQVELREERRSQHDFKNHLPPLVAFLKKLAFFKQFSASEEFTNASQGTLKALAKCVGYKHIPAYSLLILEDSPTVDQILLEDLISKDDVDNVFVVISGTVSIYKTNVQPQEQLSTIRSSTHGNVKHVMLGTLVNVVSGGDCLGEMHIMKGVRRSASAVAREECEVLVFNAFRFKSIIDKTHVKLVGQPEAAKRILNTGFISRSKDDIKILMQLAESSNFLLQFNREERKMMCRYLKFKSVAAGKTLFRQNDVGSRFYIITAGTAEVHVNPNCANIDFNSSASSASNIGPRVATLSVGDSFGEMALLERGSLRNATICAGNQMPLEMAFLELPAFLSLISENSTIQSLSFQESLAKRESRNRKAQQESDKVYVRDVLRSTPHSFFASWSEVQRDQLAVHTTLIRCDGRTVLAKQDDPSTFLFLLFKGKEFEQTRKEPTVMKDDGSQQIGANFSTTLKSNSLFGEYELLSDEKRFLYTLQTVGSSSIVVKIKSHAIKHVLQNRQDNNVETMSGYLNGLFVQRMTKKYDLFRSLFNLWGRLSSYGRSVLYHNCSVTQYCVNDIVKPSTTCKSSGSSGGGTHGIRYGFIVDGGCTMKKRIQLSAASKFVGSVHSEPKPPKRTEHHTMQPIEGMSRAARVSIKHTRKVPAVDDVPTTHKQIAEKNNTHFKHANTKTTSCVSNVGLLHRMSVLPLDAADGVHIVANTTTTVLYTKWDDQLSEVDHDKLKDLGVQIKEFVDSRLLHLKSESISVITAHTRFDSKQSIQRPTAPLPRFKINGSSRSGCGSGSNNSNSNSKNQSKNVNSNSNSSSSNSNSNNNNQSKNMHLITKLFDTDAHELSRKKFDSLLKQRYTGFVNELHPSITNYKTGKGTHPHGSSKRKDWKKFGSHINKTQRVRGEKTTLGIQVNLEHHLEHRHDYMPFYSTNHANNDSTPKQSTTSSHTKKSPRLPLHLAMRKHKKKQTTTTTTSSASRTATNGTFYLLDNIQYEPDMSLFSACDRTKKGQEIIAMLAKELDEPFDIIQRNRSLLMK